MNFLKRAHIRYILYRHRIAHALWEECTHSLIVLQGLSAVEKAHLRELTTLFLHRKKFIGAQGLELTKEMCIIVAAQACLLVLKLKIECFDGWSDVIIYPGAFRISRDSTDSAGVVHHEDNVLSGESWSRGPVILSWEDIHKEMYGDNPGRNVVVHELAHKLTAQHYGCFAEFRAFDKWLVFAIIMSFFGFVFVAPGAVMISGPVGRRRNGKISAAGPLMNLLIALLFLIILIINPSGIIKLIASYGFMINTWLGLFNMIPLGNFDGKKILRWNKAVYGVMVGVAVLFMFMQGII